MAVDAPSRAERRVAIDAGSASQHGRRARFAGHELGVQLHCGYIDKNPASRLKATGQSGSLAPKALKPVQVNALLREAQQTRHAARDYAIMQVLVQTGMRIGECTTLRLADIQLSERQGKVTIRAGKGNKARMIPLNASARQPLADYLAPRWDVEPSVKAIAAAWSKQPPSTPLWHSQKGGALSSRTMSEIVEGVVAMCLRRKRDSFKAFWRPQRMTISCDYCTHWQKAHAMETDTALISRAAQPVVR